MNTNRKWEEWEEISKTFKSLLEKPDIKTFLGDMAIPLMEGYITQMVNDSTFNRPVVFLYKDDDEPEGIRVISNTSGYDKSTCRVCKLLRRREDSRANCLMSDRIAARDIIRRYNGNGHDIEFDGVCYKWVENASTPYFKYECTHVGLTEWIFPVLIDNVCVGVFITGQFFDGLPLKADEMAANIINRYPGIDRDLLIEEETVNQNARWSFGKFFSSPEPSSYTHRNTPLTNQQIDQLHKSTSRVLQSSKAPSKQQTSWLYDRVKKAQTALTKFYTDAFSNAENQVRQYLYDNVMGKDTLYKGVDDLASNNLGSLFQRFKFVRTNLFDSAILVRDLYDLEEIGVYKPLTGPTGLEPHNIMGAILTGEQVMRRKVDGLNFDRDFRHTDKCLKTPILWDEAKDDVKGDQIMHITLKDEKCCDWLLRDTEWYIRLKMENEIVKQLIDCKHIKDANATGCAYSDKRKGIKGTRLPCDAERDKKLECPYLLSAPSDIEQLRPRFKNCCLSVYATKSYRDYPVAFFARYEAGKSDRYFNSLNSIFMYMSGAFLAQWNILLAEYNHLINAFANLYRKHESNHVLLGLIGLNNKLSREYRKTIDWHNYEVADELPPEVNQQAKIARDELQRAQGKFLIDQKVYIGRLHNIIETMDALSDDEKLNLKIIDIDRTILNRMRVSYEYFEEGQTRRLIIPPRSSSNLIPSIYADEMKIEQAISNLVSNAFKYSHQLTNIRLKKDTFTNKNNVECISISVISFGAPIPDYLKEKIFEPGFRHLTEDGEESAKRGSGLGLYIARKFARRHGGDIIMDKSVHLSDYYIPLLGSNLSKYDYRRSISHELALQCDNEYQKQIDNKVGGYKDVVNQGDHISDMIVSFPGVGFFRENIHKPTYKNIFILTIPVNAVQA